ncbi:MAG: hypothetical protein DWQ05_02180 [Calditrichaeota bacterium]|nr:MAG: hypothetical protein DWQ05_02180 [Calditrichota bacterium]
MNDLQNIKNRHDYFAPFWAAGLIILCGTGLATTWIDLGAFWRGHVLNMTGPAWNYILFRGLFTSKTENFWTRFFSPGRTFIIFIAVCFGIEGAQYFNLYESTFDPWDFLAYISILTPLFLLDLYLSMAGYPDNSARIT